MPVPPHIPSFKKFIDKIPSDHLRASVAFGLFMQSERCWVDKQNSEPNESTCRRYHLDFLTDYEINRFVEDAGENLKSFSNGIVEQKRAEFLTEMLKHHRHFRWWGVWEAFLGALAWTAFLIGFSFLLQYLGVDLIEIYKRVIGAH